MDKAAFLDKDGTLVDNENYPKEIPSDNLLSNEVLDGLKFLQEKKYKLFILSNQPWIAKKRLTSEKVENIFKSLIKKLKDHGINITEYKYCPHQSSDNCDCKKPKTKLALELTKTYNISLQDSIFIGDMDSDIICGKNLGITSVLVKTGCGKDYNSNIKPDFIIKNLNDIIKIIK